MTAEELKMVVRTLADALWQEAHRREITDYWRHNSGDYEACCIRANQQISALLSAGYTIASTPPAGLDLACWCALCPEHSDGAVGGGEWIM